jgi:hypothetical protein
MRLTPCPSPKGTNRENLYLLRLPRGTDPKGALDAALRKAKDKARDSDPDQERDLTALRGKLEEFLAQALPESHYQSAMDLLDEHLPGGKVYGEPVEDEEEYETLRSKLPDHADDDRERMANYMRDRGCSDAEIESVLEKMPRNASEGGAGGRTSEDRRGARDRGRRPAMDSRTAADRFEEMFGASRIGSSLSFR